MKLFWILFLSILFFSCEEKPKAVTATRPTLVPKDSTLIHADSLNPYAPLDRSPMDISYFPEDYPVQKMSATAKNTPLARIIYSRPQKQGRQIFGSLVKWGQPWRLGANEATELELFQSANIQNKTIPKGRYVLYAIPQEKEWTIVFNSYLFTWGLTQHPEHDLYRFTIPVQSTAKPVEYYSMVFQQNGKRADLVIAWDTVVARLPFRF